MKWFEGMKGIALALTASACSQGQAPGAPVQSSWQESRVAALEQQETALDKRIAQIEISQPDSVVLVPDDHGFGSVQTAVGAITFAVKDLAAYGDGTRVFLQIGNPTTATIGHLSAQITSAPNQPAKTFTADTLLPGHWFNTTVDVPGTPPANLHFLTIAKVTPERIFLTNPE